MPAGGGRLDGQTQRRAKPCAHGRRAWLANITGGQSRRPSAVGAHPILAREPHIPPPAAIIPRRSQQLRALEFDHNRKVSEGVWRDFQLHFTTLSKFRPIRNKISPAHAAPTVATKTKVVFKTNKVTLAAGTRMTSLAAEAPPAAEGEPDPDRCGGQGRATACSARPSLRAASTSDRPGR